MCAITGAVVRLSHTSATERTNQILNTIWTNSRERGRDGAGWLVKDSYLTFTDLGAGAKPAQRVKPPSFGMPALGGSVMIGNLRAEPTTEYVAEKHCADQQPYTSGDWSIVHNGTIANDRVLRTLDVNTNIDSAAIAEHLDATGARLQTGDTFATFVRAVRDLKGSFAILAVHKNEPDVLYAAVNYRPLWYVQTEDGVFFASSRDYFPQGLNPRMLKPYSIASFTAEGIHEQIDLLPESSNRKALVVCSGGLDSVVAATYAQRTLGMDVHLIHFRYGSRAEAPEVQSVKDVAEALGVGLTLFPLNVYSKGDSPLLDSHAKVAGGEAGAEFAHEWVPARNLLLLSVATAFAEARGIETIVLGNNLEEAGAYPDNEPEFIARFNDMLPFAVGDGKRMRVIMPVGNLMKHEIVALGHDIGAPLHLTWSCYRAGKHHCGTCGPCYMRRKAFEINNLPEVIEYAI